MGDYLTVSNNVYIVVIDGDFTVCDYNNNILSKFKIHESETDISFSTDEEFPYFKESILLFSEILYFKGNKKKNKWNR